MVSSLKLIDEINYQDGTTLDIRKSNDNSPIIKVVTKIYPTSKERFYDYLLEDYTALKLMTNASIDIKMIDETNPVFLFSSELKNDPDDGKNSRKEFSVQCKYRLNLEMRSSFTMLQNFQQTSTSKNVQFDSTQELQFQEKKKEMIYCLKDLYGYPLDDQVNQGFLDREQIISFSGILCEEYENLIKNFLQMEVCSIFQHICWCKKHSQSPYAILILGHNVIGDMKCPICSETLYSCRFIVLNPEFYPLLVSYGGFLPPLIGWHLTKKGIEWTADVKIDQHEYGDIIFKYGDKYYLIECKTRSRDKNRRGVENGIEKALTQTINHLKYWETCKVNIERTAIFTNELDNKIFKEELQQATENKAQEIDGRKIKVYPIKLIPQIISELIT